MKTKTLLETSKQPFFRSNRVQGVGAIVLCIGLCFLLIPSQAAGDLTGEFCTKWNERESTWRKSGSCPSKGTSQRKS